ncbi:MAG: hypothetical protein IJH63_01640 [Methanobrevibacter sp.]|nr:hypothetical protein [Bacilli bacterium]MBR0369410.1 hypothetical protein [Methanobrevibacter sp.]
MKLVRNNVFETNSSSTHSISICRYEKPQENNIPRNYKDVYMVSEFGDVGGSDETYACDTHNTEISKLRFLINMIASVYEDSELYENWEYERRDDEIYKKEYFRKLITQDLFVWLKEVVFEETGTEIEIEMPSNNWFPYFEQTYTEYDSIENMLDIEEDENGKYNKDKFKTRIKDIIFNSKVYIENENCPYGMER